MEVKTNGKKETNTNKKKIEIIFAVFKDCFLTLRKKRLWKNLKI